MYVFFSCPKATVVNILLYFFSDFDQSEGMYVFTWLYMAFSLTVVAHIMFYQFFKVKYIFNAFMTFLQVSVQYLKFFFSFGQLVFLFFGYDHFRNFLCIVLLWTSLCIKLFLYFGLYSSRWIFRASLELLDQRHYPFLGLGKLEQGATLSQEPVKPLAKNILKQNPQRWRDCLL